MLLSTRTGYSSLPPYIKTNMDFEMMSEWARLLWKKYINTKLDDLPYEF